MLTFIHSAPPLYGQDKQEKFSNKVEKFLRHFYSHTMPHRKPQNENELDMENYQDFRIADDSGEESCRHQRKETCAKNVAIR